VLRDSGKKEAHTLQGTRPKGWASLMVRTRPSDQSAARSALVGLLMLLALIEAAMPGEAANTENAASAPSSRTRTVTETDHDTFITLQIDDVVVLRLAAIPGTGYGWQIVKNTVPGFTLLEPPIFEDSAHGLLGGPAMEVFRFHAAATGSGALELFYKQPWEREVPPEKIFQLRIGVRDSP
jgi:inhibitor of cysteine peptidase